jgi:hypothetical protein
MYFTHIFSHLIEEIVVAAAGGRPRRREHRRGVGAIFPPRDTSKCVLAADVGRDSAAYTRLAGTGSLLWFLNLVT